MDVWADAIVRTCKSGEIAEEMKPALWRDFAALDPKFQARVGDAMWTIGPESANNYAVVAAIVGP
jgi:hypothetical protein